MLKNTKYVLKRGNMVLLAFWLFALLFPYTCNAETAKTQMPTSITMSIQQFQQLKNDNDRLASEFEMLKIDLMTFKTISIQLRNQLTECNNQLEQCKRQLTECNNQLTISNEELEIAKALLSATETSLQTLKKQIDAERKLATRTEKRLRWQRVLGYVVGGVVGGICVKLKD